MMQDRQLTVDITWHDDDAIFIAEVRELQGCIAMGKDHDELESNLRTAIGDYLEIFEDATVVEVGPLSAEMPAPAAKTTATHGKVLAGAC